MIQFVALLSLTLVGTSIADPKEDKELLESIKTKQKILNEQLAPKNPQPSTGPKAAGSTASQTKGKR